MPKYHNSPADYNGRKYHSKREAQYAWELDMLKRTGEVIDWKPQFTLPIVINNLPICKVRVDFWVLKKGSIEELHEVKGFETKDWKIKWKLLEALYGHRYRLVVIR